MGDPVLHLLAGPNGAGKTTFHDEVLGPVTALPFVNADHLAALHWPGAEAAHGHEAAALAAQERTLLLDARRSFTTETVFSHVSKLELVEHAQSLGYLVTLHVVMVPEELSVLRVPERVHNGGHHVPEHLVRARWHRLWPLVASAITVADDAAAYDNSSARHPYRRVANFWRGVPVGQADWPKWTPPVLVDLAP